VQRAVNSALLAIELFNRPSETCRSDAVLILLQHSFEMLLKAAIYEHRGSVFDSDDNFTYKFDKCLGIAKSDLNILNDDDATTLNILNDLRDCSTHYLLDLTEQALYLHTQTSITLFDQVLNSAFDKRLADYMPKRILPISTNPPKDMIAFIDSEFSQVKELLSIGHHREAEASGILRHLMILESNLLGNRNLPTVKEINKVVHQIKTGDTWQTIFPNIGNLHIDYQGQGTSVSIRFTRNLKAAPVRVVKEGEPDYENATLIKETNQLDRFNLSMRKIAIHLGITEPKTRALARYLKLQDDPNCYKEFQINTLTFKRYSQEALRKLENVLPNVDINDIWGKYGTRAGSKR
jgi:hypothetical protein